MKELEINQRIKELRKQWKLNLTAMAGKLGIAQSTYSEIESGKHSITLRHIQTLIGNSDVDLDWLIRGESRTETHSLSETRVEYNKQGNIFYLDIRASAGFGQLLHTDQNQWDIPRFFWPALPPPKEYFSLRASGDSMYPKIKPDDQFFCYKLNSAEEIKFKHPHVVVTHENEILLKELLPNKRDNTTMILRSANDAYQDRIMPKSDIFQLLPVVSNYTEKMDSYQADLVHHVEGITEKVDILWKHFRTDSRKP